MILHHNTKSFIIGTIIYGRSLLIQKILLKFHKFNKLFNCKIINHLSCYFEFQNLFGKKFYLMITNTYF